MYFIKTYGVRGLIVIVLLSIAALLLSCSVAGTAVSGDRVVDKNVKDSVHYEVILEK